MDIINTTYTKYIYKCEAYLSTLNVSEPGTKKLKYEAEKDRKLSKYFQHF